VLLITVLILIAMGVTANQTGNLKWLETSGNVVVQPFQTFFTFIEKTSTDFFSNFSDAKKLNELNKKLQNKVDKLENENRDLAAIKNENKELRDTLKLKDQFFNYKTIGGNIISKDLGNWFDVLTEVAMTELKPILQS
jgi:rod shape-determining protein MreC